MQMQEDEFFKIRAVIDDIKPKSKGCVIRSVSKEDLEYIKKARKDGKSYQVIADSLPSGHKISSTFVFNFLSDPGSKRNRFGSIGYK